MCFFFFNYRFITEFLLQILLIGLFKLSLFLIEFWWAVFLESCPKLPISSRLSNLLAYDNTLRFFFPCSIWVSVVIFLFSPPYFVYLGSLSFLGELGQRFVNFVYLFKESTLSFIDFFPIFNLYFIFPFIFIISFR